MLKRILTLSYFAGFCALITPVAANAQGVDNGTSTAVQGQSETVKMVKAVPCSIISRLWNSSGGAFFSFDEFGKLTGVGRDDFGKDEYDALADRVKACDRPTDAADVLRKIIVMRSSTESYHVEQKREKQAADRQIAEFEAARQAKNTANDAKFKAEQLLATDLKWKQLFDEVAAAIPQILKQGDLKSQFSQIADIQQKVARLPAAMQVEPLTQLATQRQLAEQLREEALTKVQASVLDARKEQDLIKRQALIAQLAVVADQLPDEDAQVLSPVISELRASIDRQMQAESDKKRNALAAQLKDAKTQSLADEQAQAERLTSPECREFKETFSQYQKNMPVIRDEILLSARQHQAGLDSDACKTIGNVATKVKAAHKVGAACLETKPQNSDEIFSYLVGINDFQKKIAPVNQEFNCE